jgi:hypothetical protein
MKTAFPRRPSRVDIAAAGATGKAAIPERTLGQGFVASLARPGGNITGTSFDAGPEITTKQLQLFIETVPKVSRV